jgi:2-keto-4-pentenoate hydratase
MDVDRLAATLAGAVRTRTPVTPLSEEVDLGAEQAYDVQEALLELLDPGVERTVAKLGLTSRAKQQQMSVDEPLYGWFPSGAALELGEPLVVAEHIQPRAEPEIAFLLGRDLQGSHVTGSLVLAATEAVLPALDVLDSRYAGYRFTLPDVIADDASAARFALGAPVPVHGIDLSLVGCAFERNDELVATAAGAAVLDHPAAAVAWLVRALARRGRGLRAGTVVLAGALTAAVPVEPGDVVRVTLDRIGSVSLACT